MTHRTTTTCLALLVMILMAGCGGGGGGGGGTNPPPPGGDTRAAITSDNAIIVAALGNAFLESYVQLTLSSLDNVFDLADTGQLSANMTCSAFSSGGTMTLLDNDGNGTISAGDRVELDYDNCLQSSLGDFVSGRVNVDITSLAIGDDLSATGNIVIRIPADLEFESGDGAPVLVSGAYRVSFTVTSTLENLDISTSGADSLRIILSDGVTSFTETAQQVAITRRISGGAYTISGSFDVNSDTVDGTFGCSVTDNLVGDLTQFPTAGTLACTGLGSSRVRVVANTSGGITTEVDPEGDGTFVNAGIVPDGNGLWGDYVEGQLFGRQIDGPSRRPTGTTPDASSVSLAINVFDAAYNAVDGRLYVTGDNGLAVVDPVTMTQVDATAIADRPGAIAISDDGTTAWIGLRDTSEIVPVDTATLNVGTRVALGNGVNIGLARFATNLRVAPGTVDTVVIASENTREVVAFRGATQLPNIVDAQGAATIIEFRDATTLVGINDASSIFAATLMSLDASGLTLLKNLPQYSSGFNATMALDGSTAWISGGRAIDVENELVLGKVDFDQFATFGFADAVYLDPAADTVWFYGDSSDTLRFFERDTFRALGEYRLPTTGQMIKMVGAAGGDVLLVFDTEIHRVDLSTLAPTSLGQSCATTDLGGQLGTAVFLQIECLFGDAIYDASRDLIYASVPSAIGRNGNSVAIINPQTGAIQSYVFVGSEPGRMSISGGGTRLFVALQESNRVAIVDLSSQTLESTVRIEDGGAFNGPGFAVSLAASTQNESDVAIATEDEVSIYGAGARLTDFIDRARDMDNLFYNADATRVYGVNANGSVWTFGVQSSGLTFVDESTRLLDSFVVKQKGDTLYDRLGAIVDAPSTTVVATCPVTGKIAVEPDPASNDIFYLQTGFDSEFQVCDRTSLTISTTFTIPRFGSGFFQPSLTKAGSNRIAITNSDKMLLLDPAEF